MAVNDSVFLSSVLYMSCIIGFVFMLVLLTLTLMIIIGAHTRRLPPRVFIKTIPNTVQQNSRKPITSGTAGLMYISPFDGILH
jgi:hypothetical protein